VWTLSRGVTACTNDASVGEKKWLVVIRDHR
jgi:hypothetical protein